MSDHITIELLNAHGACTDQVEAFAQAFPDGLTKAYARDNAVEVVALSVQYSLDIGWAAGHLLSMPANTVYQGDIKSAHAVYQEAVASALTVYREVTASARTTYQEATAPADIAYWETIASARAAHQKATTSALDSFQDAAATAFVRIWAGEAA